jgi:hypothetical protein
MILATRVPVAMLFLRSPGGLSHHPDEAVNASDVEAALLPAALWPTWSARMHELVIRGGTIAGGSPAISPSMKESLPPLARSCSLRVRKSMPRA